jgi:periplasmic divalent cation tolerance protein
MCEPQAAVLWVSIDNEAAAKSLARTLLQEKLAACVHLFPMGTSLYVWQDQLQETSEITLMIKTRSALAELLTRRIAELHPYEVPEILTLDVSHGFPAYLQWLTEQTLNP